MTPDQQDVFCKAASCGVALGLNHRYEWYVNAIRMLSHGPYEEIPTQQLRIEDAFIAFEKTTASCPEEDTYLSTLEIVEFSKMVRSWYEGNNPRDNKESQPRNEGSGGTEV